MRRAHACPVLKFGERTTYVSGDLPLRPSPLALMFWPDGSQLPPVCRCDLPRDTSGLE